MIKNAKAIQAIEKHWLEKIVELAKNTIETSKIFGKKCKEGHWNPPSAKECIESKCECKGKGNLFDILQRSQLSNLQNMANSTDSVEALKLFILYQMGRKEGEGWKFKIDSEQPFGLKVINDFEKLHKWSEEIIKDIKADPEIKKEVYLHLIRLYCGFLTRWFVARKGIEEEVETGEEE